MTNLDEGRPTDVDEQAKPIRPFPEPLGRRHGLYQRTIRELDVQHVHVWLDEIVETVDECVSDVLRVEKATQPITSGFDSSSE